MITMRVQLHCRGPTGKVSRMSEDGGWVIDVLMRKAQRAKSVESIYPFKRRQVAGIAGCPLMQTKNRPIGRFSD